jgi:hypothetical protein
MKKDVFPIDGLYKVLGPNQESCHGGSGKWVKNRWRTAEGNLQPCSNGIHLCEGKHLIKWLQAQIWFAEVRGDELEDAGDKVVVRSARIVRRTPWNEQIARLFAADCAQRALERTRITHAAIWGAVRASRQVAFGLIDDAAWSAARSAAWSAAWSAARSAADSAAWSAAWSAARSAAWSAARSATWSAARSAEQDWQTARLFDYLNNAVNLKAIKKAL